MSARRGDQRARMLRSIIDVVAEQGYTRAKIADIATGAGVSRATFYEMFTSKQQCFLEAYQKQAEAVVNRVEPAITASNPSTPVDATLAALVTLAQEDPHAFDYLTQEATLAGPVALAERERFLTGLADLIDQVVSPSGDAQDSAPDIPTRMLLSAAVRVLGMSMRRDEQNLGLVLEELLAWSRLYRAPDDARRWRHIEANPALLRATKPASNYDTFAPSVSPRGRHGVPTAVVQRTQRERILHGTATAVSRKGYAATTVADIVSAAGLSRDVFYSHFRSRREALEQATRGFFEQSIAVMAGAFFTAPAPWPERMWTAGLALCEFLITAPAFTRLVFIDAYAPDAAAARRTDELSLSFTVFIEQGASLAAANRVIPPIVPAAVVAALHETVIELIAEDRLVELPGLVAIAVYLALAPYIGVQAANEFVEHKLDELAHNT